MTQHKRTALLAAGQVQGVGFRPFIYRLAVEGGLSGSVGNTSEGVRIEVQGDPAQVDAFAVRLRRELPPLARLTRLEVTELPPVDGETEFVIVASHGHAGHSVLVSPDVGICEDCLRDMRTPGDPRFGYAFTNCTNCGPRYTITRSIPYDRATTSMACFPFCPRCEAEYRDPLDRRFHAQPVACPQCGKDIVIKKTKKGRRYYGCENNPECDFMSWQKPSAKKCPQCGGYMLEKGNKLVCADEQCGYVEAREKKDED